MPMLEVIVAQQAEPSREAQEAFAQEVQQVFQEVIGTPKGRLRLVLYLVQPLPGENYEAHEG